MARRSRLRSWWRSRFRRRLAPTTYSAHRAVNLLPPEHAELLATLGGGSAPLSAFTGTRERGTPTPATATTAGCSFYLAPGEVLGAGGGLTLYRLPSSSGVHFSFGGETVAPGVSGEPLGPAV